MKTKKIELDVDFIGGQGSLTIAEEKVLSDFLKKHKSTLNKSVDKKKLNPVKRQKIKA